MATTKGKAFDPRRRRAARLAAVQALYGMELSGSNAQYALAGFVSRGSTAELDEGSKLAADPAHMADLVRGVQARLEDIDTLIGNALDKGRQLPRLEAVLRAILRCGTYELIGRGDIDAPVAISEWVAIAGSFFDGPEPTLVNAVLDRIAQKVRAEDLDEPVDLPDDDGGDA